MARLLIFNFDGTGNEPQDAQQDVSKKGKKEDDNVSNVLKFHLMCGGNLHKNTSERYGNSSLQGVRHAFYYQGVGTYGNWFSRAINQGLAIESQDVASIIRAAIADFTRCYKKGDVLLVTGFSRGAALARRFVSLIGRLDIVSQNTPFVYLGAWDTVASIGLPNLSKASRPDYDVVFEDGCTLSSAVAKATHMVSLDDKRKAFQPTLMNYDPVRIQEIWFAGAHSDVGGGYYRDGLSDIALSYFLNWLTERGQQDTRLLNVNFSLPGEQELEEALPEKAKYVIGLDDIQITPDPFAKNHQQDRWPVVDWLTLDDREFCVIDRDKINPGLKPLLHNSVAVRINGDRSYRPKSLINKLHSVWHGEDDRVDSVGMKDHEVMARRNWKSLENVGDSIALSVFASEKYNHTGLLMEKGREYDIKVLEDQFWYDASIKCDAEGWNREDINKGLAEVAIKFMESRRRVPDRDWFFLCCSIDDSDEVVYPVGKHARGFSPHKTGEFCPFANDLDSRYGNNRGKITLNVTLTK